MNAQKHTPGAIRAAEIITGGTLGDGNTYATTYGRKTVAGVADIIDGQTAAPDLLEACQGLLEHLPDDDWSDDPADPTCPWCGRPNPAAADDGAVEGPRAYHAECWYRVDAARDAIAKATGEE